MLMRLSQLASLSILLGGCAVTHVAPFTASPDRGSLGPGQRAVWRSADKQDDRFSNIGADYDDPALQAYVKGLVDRLYPEFKGAMQVHLLESTKPDAFMMANGSCYVQLGLLSLLQDESSLALVLSHEGVHFVDQHAVEERGHVDEVELEAEADRSGYQRYLKAGFPAAGAAEPFL